MSEQHTDSTIRSGRLEDPPTPPPFYLRRFSAPVALPLRPTSLQVDTGKGQQMIVDPRLLNKKGRKQPEEELSLSRVGKSVKRPTFDGGGILIGALDRRDFECGICHEVMHRIVAVSPCLHRFCSSCLSNWLQRAAEPTCPFCRGPVDYVAPDRIMQNIADKIGATKMLRRKSRDLKDETDHLHHIDYQLEKLVKIRTENDKYDDQDDESTFAGLTNDQLEIFLWMLRRVFIIRAEQWPDERVIRFVATHINTFWEIPHDIRWFMEFGDSLCHPEFSHDVNGRPDGLNRTRVRWLAARLRCVHVCSMEPQWARIVPSVRIVSQEVYGPLKKNNMREFEILQARIRRWQEWNDMDSSSDDDDGSSEEDSAAWSPDDSPREMYEDSEVLAIDMSALENASPPSSMEASEEIPQQKDQEEQQPPETTEDGDGDGDGDSVRRITVVWKR